MVRYSLFVLKLPLNTNQPTLTPNLYAAMIMMLNTSRNASDSLRRRNNRTCDEFHRPQNAVLHTYKDEANQVEWIWAPGS